MKIVVLAKQVPDTRNVGKDAMKADGTVNRAALPAIFNPEDLNALEQALDHQGHVPRQHGGDPDHGPAAAPPKSYAKPCTAEPTAAYLLTDRANSPAADTLATSYALSRAHAST